MKNQSLKNRNYTNKELAELGWATIGGRIEDYFVTFKKKSLEAARLQIKKHYGLDYQDVYRGLIVYIRFGAECYYKDGSSITVSEKYNTLAKKWNQDSTNGNCPDDLNPLFTFNLVDTEILRKIVRNELDARQLAMLELRNRCLEF